MPLSLAERDQDLTAVAAAPRNADTPLALPLLQIVNAQTSDRGNRLFFIEFLRCFAIIQVILLHASAPFAVTVSAKGNFWIGCIVDSAARSCVPLFLLISGMLLLSSTHEESAVSFLRRRFWRVGMPLIAWTLIYCCWRLNNGAHLNWQSVVNQPACYHLQYLYYLVGLYLATPILRAFLKGADRRLVFYFLALWFVGASILPALGSLTGIAPPIIFTVTTGFSGYFILGYVLRDYKIAENRYLHFGLLACACLAITIFGTYFLTFNQAVPKLNEALFDYSSPQVIVYSAILFLAAKSFSFKFAGAAGRLAARAIESLSAASFTIYLVHPIILSFLSSQFKWMLALEAHRSLLTLGYLLAVTSATLLLSWFFFLACRRLKIPTWIAP